VRSVRYHPDASAEFLREIEYYLALNPALSGRFDRAVRACEVNRPGFELTPRSWTVCHRANYVVFLSRYPTGLSPFSLSLIRS